MRVPCAPGFRPEEGFRCAVPAVTRYDAGGPLAGERSGSGHRSQNEEHLMRFRIPGGAATAVSALVATALVALSATDAGAQQPGAPDQALEPPSRPRESFEPPEWAPVPDDLDIVIMREDEIPGQFRILDVEVSREIDEELLGIVATLLRDADDMIYMRTYVVFYLPGMRSGERAWATAHFLPDLEVQLVEDAPATDSP